MFTLLLAFTITPVLSFPTGAPSSACSTFTPDHGVSAQANDAPYEIDISVFETLNLDYGYVPGLTYPSKYSMCTVAIKI